MSAFIVNQAHIDALVCAAVFGPKRVVSPDHSWFGVADPDTGERLTNDAADRIGMELWSENLRSVAYHYPDDGDGGRPGPVEFKDGDTARYVFPVMTPKRPAVEILKAISCLEYQSCEHPEWAASWSARLLRNLREVVIGYLPGYDEADWEIPALR